MLGQFGEVRSVAEVTTFKLQRVAKDGHDQIVTVIAYDYGPSSDRARWSVAATSDDGLTAAGNPGLDLSTTLRVVHWSDLDKPLSP